jgi:hypothetical protein
MAKFLTLIALTLLGLTVIAGENTVGANLTSTHLNNVNVYTNAPAKSFIADFYEKYFKAVTVKVCDLSGKQFAKYELGDIKSGYYAEINIPKEIISNNMMITISSEGKSMVEKSDIYSSI